jgi:MFS family permease
MAIQNLAWGVAQPLGGTLADRFGPARVLAGGGLLYALGLALMAFSTTPGALHLSAGMLVGVGMGGASYITVLAALGKIVPPERRSWALGLGTAAGRMLLCGLYLGRAAAIAVFITLPITPASVLLFAAVMGLLWLSAVPPTSGLVALMFGTRYMATLFGIVFLNHQLGSFTGVWLGGWLYARTGSYDVVWWLSVLLSLAAALLHLPIAERPARHFAQRRPAPPGPARPATND